MKTNLNNSTLSWNTFGVWLGAREILWEQHQRRHGESTDLYKMLIWMFGLFAHTKEKHGARSCKRLCACPCKHRIDAEVYLMITCARTFSCQTTFEKKPLILALSFCSGIVYLDHIRFHFGLRFIVAN